ncbi:hypothetical protein [Ornithinimicrobium cavernae]|uniref:hypothetical protein n=1 Tax=Ornithinimicrobium cavernae TaxID=2666047 RepID=UPI000D68B9D5|nr:hypothetical protein [Ornithinimicrobium cavernae]
MSQPPPETGDPVVDEVLVTFRASAEAPLGDRAEAAVLAQRRLQERLSESAPGNGPAAAMRRAAGGPQSS